MYLFIYLYIYYLRYIDLRLNLIVCPMRPFLYNAVEYLPGTLGGTQLTMPVEPIVWHEFLEAHALLDEQLTGAQLLLSWTQLDVGANEGDAYAIHIVAESVRALVVPAATLVD